MVEDAPEEDKYSKIDRLGTGSINRIMLEFAIPAIGGIIVNALYNVIDAIFLGQCVGKLGLAVTTVATPIMTVMIAAAMFIGVGGNAVAAIRFGEGRRIEAEKTLGNSFTLLIIMWLVMLLIGFVFINPLLWLSGATTDSFDMSKAFIQIICAGFIFQSVGFGLNNFIRTAGAPKRALMTMVIGAVTCTVFNYLFVVRFGWGVVGSACATLVGQGASMVFVLAYFMSDKAPFRLRRRYLRLEKDVSKQIMLLGTAPFALQIAQSIVMFVLNNLLNVYGAASAIGADGALAALGVVMKVAMFLVFPVAGITQAAQPLFGYNYGAHKYDRVKTTIKVATIWATVITCISCVLVQGIPGVIVDIFNVEAGLRDFTVSALRIWLLMLPIIGAQIVWSNYFQATGQPIRAMVLTLSRQILFLLPLYYFLPKVLPILFGTDALVAICYAPPISDALAFVLTGAFILVEIRRLTKLQNREKNFADRDGEVLATMDS